MKVKLEFKLEDFWVGAFWKKELVVVKDPSYYWLDGVGTQYDLWVCIVPCFPIHVTWTRP
jgi:hypothetical protein